MNNLTTLDWLYKWEKEKPNSIYLSQPINGVWHNWTFYDFGQEVRKMASYIKSLNLKKNSKIGILSKNCAHWIMSDLAIMLSGHISVPLYPNLNSESLNKILLHSETQLLFVGKLDNFDLIKDGIPSNINCITFPFYSQDYPIWDDLIEGIQPIEDNEEKDANDLASIIYTSGTTGDAKGVMHSFANFSFATINASKSLEIVNREIFFSYLPLSHIAERLLIEMCSLYTGSRIYFAESLETFAANLSYASPTVFLGVPRIWTKFQQGILLKLPQKKLDRLLKIPFVSFLIKNKIKKGLGLKRANNVFTGAAPTPVATINWFAKLGIFIQEAYAMTENTCYSHVTLKDNIRVGYVGQALPKCEVKFSQEKEILIKHEALMLGYYKDIDKTNEIIKDGWLHTGDEGEIDKDGFLRITGRVKDIFKTSKGKYIAPSPIEMKLSENSNIGQVCVVGTGIPQPIALVVLSENAKKTVNYKASIEETLKDVNQTLDKHEVIHNLIVVDDVWTVENKFLTPSMKIKRKTIEKKYQANYSTWYDQDNILVL
ncbi:AMP-binding protein [Flavobacteriales bacterium]|nr:AMP-binding protein [Flavobacteriales bacterium]